MKNWRLLVCGLLVTACASTNIAQQRWETADAEPETEECDDPGADRCTMFICGVGACGLYYCKDVDPGGIVRAQAVAPIRPPMPGVAAPFPTPANPQRYWGSMQGLPRDAAPIFIIPWHETEEEYAARLRKEQEDQPKRTWVKHHVFPRAFKTWFNARGVNIHEWTLVVDKQVHLKIHRGAAGGPWNAEWYLYIIDNPLGNPQAIHLFATQMIFRYDLSGPVVPYSRKKAIPLFPNIEEDIH
ncbi:TIGR02269 family lipoprotein [Pyxidicoccus sp. MSG2]|uniref:SitA6 family polymorphic toxin lipoprotein n=1 Tax=Pyxidicoccus sp. MSG2 TaxID=2996790 RepID=UPI00226F69CE|nr:TIGR02269 family lipoprotein [Pyxidicoccus sp. MSG2]MCY1017090.1 TIGR02269 family lipoprotein [Pyxidicoccus sp. MSG2]